MKYITLIIFFLMLFYSCNSENTNLSISPKGVFTISETTEITSMLEEFKISICESKESESIDCIEKYFQDYWSNFENGKIQTLIDSNALKKILKPISKNLRSKLFEDQTSIFAIRIPNSTPALTITDTIEYLAVNRIDVYFPILNYLSEKYPHLKEVEESTKNLNSLAPHDLISIYSNWNKYSYTDNTELLFLTMIIISQSDNSIKIETAKYEAIRPIEEKLEKRNLNSSN